MNKQITCIIVTIHGTFAPGADWTRENSFLCSNITKLLSDESVLIEYLDWTGRLPGVLSRLNNSHRARIIAASRLKERLRCLIREYPEASIFLIGHSHGGNVALYAMRDAEILGEIAGIVTLSTPFITCRPRPFDRSRLAGNLAGITAAGSISPLLSLLCAAAASSFLTDGEVGRASLAGVGSVLAVVLFFLCQRLSKWLDYMEGDLSRRNKHVAAVLAEVSTPSISEELLFCASGAWDEAAVSLGLIDAICSTPFKVARAIGYLGMYGLSIFLSAKLRIIQVMIGAYPGQHWYNHLFHLVLALLMSLPIFLGLCLLTWTWATLVPVVLRFIAMGFSPLRLQDSLLVEVEIRKAPPGISRWRGYISSAGGMAHSRLYSDIDVVSDIGEWIRVRLKHKMPLVADEQRVL